MLYVGRVRMFLVFMRTIMGMWQQNVYDLNNISVLKFTKMHHYGVIFQYHIIIYHPDPVPL